MPALPIGFSSQTEIMYREIADRFTIDKLHAAKKQLTDAMGEEYLKKYIVEVQYSLEKDMLLGPSRRDAVKPTPKASAMFNRKLLLRR